MKAATQMPAVGRVTPCAPRSHTIAPNGAHGVTRPTNADCGCIFTPANMETLSTPLLIASWICRLAATVILLQTSFQTEST